MKTFSRLSLLTFVFLGIAFMLVGNTVYAQSLEVYTAGGQAEYEIGDPVKVTFVVDPPETVVNLLVSAVGVNITSISGVTAPGAIPGKYATENKGGSLVVEGIITSSGAYISAMWDRGAADDLSARADLTGSPDAPRIVVDPPNVNTLQVGDTFTQQIWARDFLPPITIGLSAWHMDITYNPKVLKFVKAIPKSPPSEDGSIIDGFLEKGGVETLFVATPGNGKISAYQARIGTPPVLGVTGSGLLLTVEFELLEFAEEALGLSNIQLSNSQLGATTDVQSQMSRESYHVVVNPIVATHRYPAVDVNRDGMVNVLDLQVIASSLKTVPSNPRADVNNDGFVNALDLMAVASSPSWGQAVTATSIRTANDPGAKGKAPQVHVANVATHGTANVTPEMIQKWIEIGRIEDDGSAIFDLGIANLEALLASMIPTETRLLLNYPNPFNPETWIPYQLSESTDVTMTIHSMNGSLIRTLELGHQASGTYQSKSQAAYWDGRNEFGEQVASGLYFYTLTAGNFSATGKMLVRK